MDELSVMRGLIKNSALETKFIRTQIEMETNDEIKKLLNQDLNNAEKFNKCI